MQWKRSCKRETREADLEFLDTLWGDSKKSYISSYYYDDVFQLKKLYGMEPYDISYDSENWDEESKEPPKKRFRNE